MRRKRRLRNALVGSIAGFVLVAGGGVAIASNYRGQDERNQPAGQQYEVVQIGNRVWNDTNSDGTQTDGEPGISGVTVELLDENDSTVATMITAADGSYGFEVKPGVYSVRVVSPEGCRYTTYRAGGPEMTSMPWDSEADADSGTTDKLELNANESFLGMDIGLLCEERPSLVQPLVPPVSIDPVPGSFDYPRYPDWIDVPAVPSPAVPGTSFNPSKCAAFEGNDEIECSIAPPDFYVCIRKSDRVPVCVA